MWWLAKFFWIFKFKETTKTLNCDMFRPQPTKKVYLTFGRTLTKISTKIYFVVELFKKVWTWGGEILNALFCKNDLFLDVGCCPNIVDETLILSSIVWEKDSDKFSSNVSSIYFHLTSYSSLLLLLLRIQNCTKGNTTKVSKK